MSRRGDLFIFTSPKNSEAATQGLIKACAASYSILLRLAKQISPRIEACQGAISKDRTLDRPCVTS